MSAQAVDLVPERSRYSNPKLLLSSSETAHADPQGTVRMASLR